MLAILLEGLEGPAYEEFRKTLSTARERLDPELAARHLRSFLVLEIKRIAKEADERLKSGTSKDRERDKNRRSFGKTLPLFLDDPEVWEGLLGPNSKPPGAIAQLAVHVTEEGNSEVDERVHQFEPGNFDIESQDINPASMSRPARDFYLVLNSDERRVRAANLVNEALDRAKEQLLNIGDNSLTDLFASIRAQLHQDGRELVLLVEDFAVLSGLQGALFDVMVKEAHREGRQELCTLRSALAYTAGYYVPDTVRTRAQAEWAIEERPDNDEKIIDRFCDLAGAYLNAARVGVGEIENRYAQNASQEDRQGWIPSVDVDGLESEAAAACEAFGRADSGRLLFPLNRAAVRRLSLEGCLDGTGRLEFNPRKLIRNVLDKVLPFRHAFEEGAFPPESLGTRSLQAGEVTEAVEGMRLGSKKGQYRKLLAYWADQPRDLGAAAKLDPRIYEVFGLEPLMFAAGARTGPPPATLRDAAQRPGRDKMVQPPPPPAEARGAAPHREWDDKLQRWQEGETLAQSDAKHIRKAILEGMLKFIDFDYHLFKPGRKPASGEVYLPRSKGQDRTAPDAAFVCVCSEDELADEAKASSILRFLKAVIRFHAVYHSWEYTGGEEDSAAYAAFLALHSRSAAEYVKSRYFTLHPDDTLSFLVAGLAVAGRVLGIEGSAKSGYRPFLNHIFREPGDDIAKSVPRESDRRWDRVSRLALEVYAGDDKNRAWREMLKDQIGARQGGADTVHAVDSARLRPSFEEFAKSWDLAGVPLPEPKDNAELKTALSLFKEMRQLLPKAVAEEQGALSTWHGEVSNWLGGTKVDKQKLVERLEEALKSAKGSGLTSRVDYPALKRQVKAFGASAITATLEDAGRLAEEPSPEVVLSLIARQDEKTVSVTRELRKRLTSMFDEVEQNLDEHGKAVGPDPVKAAQIEIQVEFDEIAAILNEIGGLEP